MLCDSISEFINVPFRFGPGNTQVFDWPSPHGLIVVAKPLTFMNNSGDAVLKLQSSYELGKDRICIVCDDFQLPLGSLRIRKSGGAGGHNGLKSIIDNLMTREFTRLRIGIGALERDEDWVDFVLSNFKRNELKIVRDLIEIARESVLCIAADGIEKAMNLYNKDYLNKPDLKED